MPVNRRIGFEMKSVSHQIKQCIDQTIAQSKTDGITGMQGWIIGYLYRHREAEGLFQHDLEQEFNIRRSTATGLLQRMERDGLIVRSSIQSDARRKNITLTQKAVDIHHNVMRAIDQVEDSLTRGLTAEEVETFFRILDKVKQNLSAPPSAQQPPRADNAESGSPTTDNGGHV